MTKIENIKRISVDLLKLKPIGSQKKVYDSYKSYLNQYFNNGSIKKECFEYISCPVCDKINNDVLIEIDYFKYIRCVDCGSVYNNPRLKNKYLEKMYTDGEYDNYVKKLTVPGDEIRRNITEVRKFEQVNSLFKQTGKILDVGCGTGTFLGIAAENGWNCTGVELSRDDTDTMSEKNIHVYKTSFNDFDTLDKFDCITFWGVLEHVINPIEQIKKAFSLLNKNGVIVYEVPSSDSLIMQYVIKRNFSPFRFIESARHLTFFSKNVISIICSVLNLKLEYVESNGLDIQTVLLYEFDQEIIDKIKNIQQLIDENLLSDHYRVFLRKI